MVKFWRILGLLCAVFFCCKGASIGISGENGNIDEVRGRQIDDLAQPKILIPWSQKLALLFPTTTTTPAPTPAPAPAAAAPAPAPVPAPGGFFAYSAQPGGFPSFPNIPDQVDFGRRPSSPVQPIFIVGGQPNMPFPFWG